MCQPLTKRANVLKINKNTKTKYHNDDDDDGALVMKVYHQSGSLNFVPNQKHIGLGIDTST